jgi:hypothetical protein
MDDYIKSIKAQLYDRATSPLFGTFALSWVGWNYKFIVVLLESAPAADRLWYVSNVLYEGWFDRVFQGFIFPTLTSLLFIYVYPILAQPIYLYVREQQKKLRDIKQKIEGETVLTIEESRVIRSAAFVKHRALERTIEERDISIQQLNEMIMKLEKGISEFPSGPRVQSSLAEKSYRLKDGQIEMLQHIAEQGPLAKSAAIFKFAEKYDKVTAEYDFGELFRLHLVSPVVVGASQLYNATHEGLGELISLGLYKSSKESVV